MKKINLFISGTLLALLTACQQAETQEQQAHDFQKAVAFFVTRLGDKQALSLFCPEGRVSLTRSGEHDAIVLTSNQWENSHILLRQDGTLEAVVYHTAAVELPVAKENLKETQKNATYKKLITAAQDCQP
jgi:hypothetical protein